jgi:hypothetical protein
MSQKLNHLLALFISFQEHVKSLAWNIENKLSASGSDFVWSFDVEQEYQWVKKQMKDPVVLTLWSSVKTSCLYTDASSKGLGCFLTQLSEDNKTEVIIVFGSITLTSVQKKYQITRAKVLAFIWALGHFHPYLCTRPFLWKWKADHHALKYIFDVSKSQVPVLARYQLIADEYKFSPVWISSSTMIADAFSHLCIIAVDKHIAMTNHKMVMADLDLSKISDVNSRQYMRNNATDFLLSHTDVDFCPLDLNPHDQPLHVDKDSLRGKLPSFSA